MLILTFRPGESVTVAGPCEIVVMHARPEDAEKVRIGIDAEKGVHIGQVQPVHERHVRILDA